MFHKKWLVSAAVVSLLVSGSTFAASAAPASGEAENWDKPSAAKFQSYKIEQKLLYTKADVRWSGEQLDKFQNTDRYRQFFPAFRLQVQESVDTRAKLMVSNLPGAKFTRTKAGYTDGEEIKLSVLDTSSLTQNKPYTFYTAWLNLLEDHPTVSLSSLQRYSQPGGSLYDLSGPADLLHKENFTNAEPLDMKYNRLGLPPGFDDLFKQYPHQKEPSATKVKSYALINSKEALEAFKKEAASTLHNSFDSEKVQFAVTFTKPFTAQHLKKLEEKYELNLAQIYAAGITANKEEYTVSWFDSDVETASLLRIPQAGFIHFNLTELEGTATVEGLNKLRLDLNPDVIEIAPLDEPAPTGIHWLNRKFLNQ
ncbi:hypothetical protein [Paenibacillus sp. UNC499MF]|uniref:hypothetical protein n=1 Tax=Paenibacillus sp. UNC499MF TaxID=1502751 RepID=UPI0008A06CF7|nr:hypothetical protein [Paenibacillus sp. UNC499MF]SEF82841.1 hypothetical protein SAMN02799616_01133 [Paenibacillus sp. UNC499MF]